MRTRTFLRPHQSKVARPAHTALAALPLAAILALTGCGSDDSGSDDSGSDASGSGVASANGGETQDDSNEPDAAQSQDEMDQMALKFAQCMRDNGVEDFPDPEQGGGTLDEEIIEDPDFQTADEACAEYLPQGGQPPEDLQEMQDGLLDMAQCMRDNGVEAFPDPEQGGGMIDKEIEEDPDFDKAFEICDEAFGPDDAQRIDGGQG